MSQLTPTRHFTDPRPWPHAGLAHHQRRANHHGASHRPTAAVGPFVRRRRLRLYATAGDINQLPSASQMARSGRRRRQRRWNRRGERTRRQPRTSRRRATGHCMRAATARRTSTRRRDLLTWTCFFSWSCVLHVPETGRSARDELRA